MSRITEILAIFFMVMGGIYCCVLWSRLMDYLCGSKKETDREISGRCWHD